MKAPKSLALTEEGIVANLCRRSFYDFVREFWSVVIPETAVYNWHIEYLCDELQKVAELVFAGKPKAYDLIINVPPGSTKSTICSQMFPAWVWTRMPEARHICASYAHELALTHSRKCRLIVESEKYRRMFGIELSTDQNTKAMFENNHKGYRVSVGSGGAITGMHGHFILVDDPINAEDSASKANREATNRWMGETLSTRKVDKSVTPTIVIMQRLHEDDPTGALLERNKGTSAIRHICLPAEDSELVNPPELRARYKDGLLDPVRIPRAVLEQQKRDLGEFGYAGQFEQRPVPREGGLFRREKVGLMEFVPPTQELVSCVRYWDKAGTQGSGCYSVGTLIGKDTAGRFWVLDVTRGQWASNKREEIIKHTAEMDGVGVRIGIEQEPGSGGKESAEATVRNLAGFIVEIDRPTGDKETRAIPFSVQVNNGNVYVPKRAPWLNDWLNELQFFPASKLKDQVDSASAGFALCSRVRTRAGGLW